MAYLGHKRGEELEYFPWARPDLHEFTLLFADQWSWPVQPDQLTFCERVVFYPFIEVPLFDTSRSSKCVADLLMRIAQGDTKVSYVLRCYRCVIVRRRGN